MSEFQELYRTETLAGLQRNFGGPLQYQERGDNKPVHELHAVAIGPEVRTESDNGTGGRRVQVVRAVTLCVDPESAAFCGLREIAMNANAWVATAAYAVRDVEYAGHGTRQVNLVRTGAMSKTRPNYDTRAT